MTIFKILRGEKTKEVSPIRLNPANNHHEAGLDPSHGAARLDEVTVSPAGFGFILTSTKPAPLPSLFYSHCSNQALIIRRTLITIINCARQVDEASESFNRAIQVKKCVVVVTQRERERERESSYNSLRLNLFLIFLL